MNKISINIFLLFNIIFLFTKCDLDDNKLLVRNKSTKNIYCEVSLDTITSIKYFDYMSKIPKMKLHPNDSIRPLFARKGEGWENKINRYSVDSNLHIFFFVVDTVEKYGWDKILQKRMYERKDFKVKQLESMHWCYDYFPTWSKETLVNQ